MTLRLGLGLAIVLCGVARASEPDALNRKLSDLTGRIAQLENERDEAELLFSVASFVGKHGDASGYRIKAVFLDLDARKLKREQRRLLKSKLKDGRSKSGVSKLDLESQMNADNAVAPKVCSARLSYHAAGETAPGP